MNGGLPGYPPSSILYPRYFTSSPVGLAQDLDRVFRRHAAALRDLPAERLRAAQGQLAAAAANEIEQCGADVHRDLILLPLVAVGPGDAATVSGALVEPQAGYEPQHIQRRPADPVRAQLAWRMIRQRPL